MKLWTAALYLIARWEVSRSRLGGRQIHESGNAPDELVHILVPSIRIKGCDDRVLAEIDQDGFIFAVDPDDVLLFPTRTVMAPRKHHRVEIILTQGNVRLRKTSIGEENVGILARLRSFLRWGFYLEAAALLRLRGVSGIPTIRRLDLETGAIEMDYIFGTDLRTVFSSGRDEIQYDDVSRQFSTLLTDIDNHLGSQVAVLLSEVIDRGVVPRDIHAANFVRAQMTGRLYLVDFNLVFLRPVPGWRRYAQNIAEMFAKTQSAVLFKSFY